jgi:hypothetical protein
MGTIEDKLRELQEREQVLLLDLSAVRAAIDVYIKGRLRSNTPGGQTEPNSPTLDDMRIKDAINVYLQWARDNGRDKVTLKELHDVLRQNRIITAKKEIMDRDRVWTNITIAVSSPTLANRWNVTRLDPNRYNMRDTIELRPKKIAESGLPSNGQTG